MDLLSAKANSSPREFARGLQERGPVFWSEPENIWVVTDHKIGTAALRDPVFSADRSSFFMSRMGACPFAKVANFFGVVKNMMVTSDGAEHTARRKLAASGISDHILDGFQPQVEKVVDELLLPLLKGEKLDFVEKIALPLPNIVLADLFSIPQGERENFYQWANHMTQFFGGGSDFENADLGAASLRGYFQRLIDERRQKPRGDFISHMLRQQGELGDDELISQAAIMLVAGTITTRDQICNCLAVWLENGKWKELAKDPAALDAAIEEAARLDPAVNFIFRVAKENTRLGNLEIGAGQLVFVSTHAANRDAQVFADPHAFDGARGRNPHMSFGSGLHYCLGARLGRIQMKILFGRLLARFPGLEDVPLDPPVRKHQSLGFSGFERFPIQVAP